MISFFLLIILLPIFITLSIAILLDDGFPFLYIQKRVGKKGIEFNLFKFRSMRKGSENFGRLTIGSKDPRVLRTGFFLRKYKLDELPQLINVLNGTMSFVGPRPEVAEFVDLYTEDQRVVLEVRPGITDLASIKFRNENQILARSLDPRRTYIEDIMPQKILMNMAYIRNKSVLKYFSIIFVTIREILYPDGH